MTAPIDSTTVLPTVPDAPTEPGVAATPTEGATSDEAATSTGVATPAEAATPTVDLEQEKRRRRRRGLFLVLLSLFGLFVLFSGWYLLTRKPITQILPPVTVDQLPHYSFSIYGVSGPTGVAVNADGSRIYATQTEGDQQVIAFDASGKAIASLKPPANTGPEHVPVYVAVNPTNGDVYVSDRPTGQIYIFAADGGYRRTFNPGSAATGWGGPLGLAFDSHGGLFVTCVAGTFQAVFEFDPAGTFVRTFGKPGELNFPNGVAVDGAGNVYVTDSNNGRMFVFDPSGSRIGVAKRGSANGDLAIPRGAAIDDQGRVYVADITVQGIQVFRTLKAGETQPKYIGRLGIEGSGDGAFEFPNAVAVDGRARVYVADWRNNRIQVWSY